jgi:hypothetical protein
LSAPSGDARGTAAVGSQLWHHHVALAPATPVKIFLPCPVSRELRSPHVFFATRGLSLRGCSPSRSPTALTGPMIETVKASMVHDIPSIANRTDEVLLLRCFK